MLNQNKSRELTTADVKEIEEFKNITEDEARDIISQIEALSLICYELYQDKCARESQLLKTKDTHKEVTGKLKKRKTKI